MSDEQPADRRCENCRFFLDYRESEPDPEEVNGYCCHPMHREQGSPNQPYGGHWTNHASWCEGWRLRKTTDAGISTDDGRGTTEPG